ncbi:MAG TPA: hypothetical protein VG797_02745 [Phycisphaerales bacterium]|nr:hypothetical protein [Phycisphaerales bacterium]
MNSSSFGRLFRRACQALSLVIASTAVAQTQPLCCTDFNYFDLNGWGPCAAAPNVTVSIGSPGPSGNPGDNYLRIEDESGASAACSNQQCVGDWRPYANSGCGALCFDVRIFFDGCVTGIPACEPNGWIPITPTIIIKSGTLRAVWRANTHITVDIGDAPGWHNFCCVLGPLNPDGSLPSDDVGFWQMLDGAPNTDWMTLLSNVTEMQLPIDFTANPAEIAGYDNICLRNDQCHCMQVETTRLDCVPNGTGNTHTWTFCVTNTSGQTANALSILVPPGITLSNQAFAINPPLANGDTRCFTLTVTGAPQDIATCFTFILRRTVVGAPPTECCRGDVCITPPTCCVEVQGTLTQTAVGYRYCFHVTNLSGFPLHHLFIVDDDPDNAPSYTPQYFTISPPILPGTSGAQLFCVDIIGATPGSTICFDVEVHDEDVDPCCYEQICVDIPGACPCPSPCPQGARPEPEPCGEHINDVCDPFNPAAVFISPPEPNCGKTMSDATGVADIDWWYLNVTAGTSYNVQFASQFLAKITVYFMQQGAPCPGEIILTRLVDPCIDIAFSFTASGTGIAAIVIEPVQPSLIPCADCNNYAFRVLPMQMSCHGDGNIDGVIGVADLAPVIMHWGGAGSVGDYDYDGHVGLSDLAVVINEWGTRCN